MALRKLRVVRYDEVRDPYEFLTLMSQGFGWHAHARRVARIRRADARYRDPYGFFALDGKAVAGFAGTIDLPVRTLDRGLERAGGLFCVATRPDYARRGVARTLVRHAHRHFRERGYRFSFLYTSRSLVAYSLYRQLGYDDVPESAEAAARWVRIFRPGRPAPRRPAKPAPADVRRAERLFRETTRDWTGFVARPSNWLSVRWKSGSGNPEELLVDAEGYALTGQGWDSTFLFEVVARNQDAYRRIIDRARRLGRPNVVGIRAYDPVLRELYRELGFRPQLAAYGRLMVLPLSPTRFAAAFGDRFRHSPADAF